MISPTSIFKYISSFFWKELKGFEKLPDELIQSIFNLLEPQMLARVPLVCRRWHQITEDPLFWKKRAMAELDLNSSYEPQISWKDLYLKRILGFEKFLKTEHCHIEHRFVEDSTLLFNETPKNLHLFWDAADKKCILKRKLLAHNPPSLIHRTPFDTISLKEIVSLSLGPADKKSYLLCDALKKPDQGPIEHYMVLLDPLTGNCEYTFAIPTESFSWLYFFVHDQNPYVVSCSLNVVQVWSLKTNKLLHTLKEEIDAFYGRLLLIFTTSENKTCIAFNKKIGGSVCAVVWDLMENRQIFCLDTGLDPACANFQFYLVNLTSGETKLIITTHHSEVDSENEISLWNLLTWEKERTIKQFPCKSRIQFSVQSTKQNDYLVTWVDNDQQCELNVWDLTHQEEIISDQQLHHFFKSTYRFNSLMRPREPFSLKFAILFSNNTPYLFVYSEPVMALYDLKTRNKQCSAHSSFYHYQSIQIAEINHFPYLLFLDKAKTGGFHWLSFINLCNPVQNDKLPSGQINSMSSKQKLPITTRQPLLLSVFKIIAISSAILGLIYALRKKTLKI